jgi:uncharacterized protein YggE
LPAKNEKLAIPNPGLEKVVQFCLTFPSGKVTVPTNLTQVELGIEVEKETAAEVQEEVARLSATVVEELKELGVQELQTTEIRLEPVFRFTDNTRERIGFEGRNTLQFQIPTDRAGAAIDRAVQAGANLIENISFIASDPELEEARLQAIRQAVQDARIQANEIFKELQLIPGEIIDIDIDAEIPRPIPLLERAGVEAFAATTPILGGPQTVDATVNLDILYFPDPAGNLQVSLI